MAGAFVSGVVSYITVAAQHGINGSVLGSQLRLTIRQTHPRSPTIDVVLDTGTGNTGLQTADAMKARLRVGTPCSAHGAWVGCNGDSRRLQLHGVQYVRGGEARHHHDPEDQHTEATA